MFDKYILINKKPQKYLKNYLFSLLLLTILIIIIYHSLKTTPYLEKKGKIKYLEKNYYLKLNIKKSDYKTISSKKTIIIDNNKYYYQIYKKENTTYLYLKIKNLPNSYKIKNYQTTIKIKK